MLLPVPVERPVSPTYSLGWSMWVSVLAHGPGSQPSHQPPELLVSQAQSPVCRPAAALVLGVKIVPQTVPAPSEVSPLQVPGHDETAVPVSVAVTASAAVPAPPRTWVQKGQCERTRDCGPPWLRNSGWPLTVPSPNRNPLSAISWAVIGQRGERLHEGFQIPTWARCCLRPAAPGQPERARSFHVNHPGPWIFSSD